MPHTATAESLNATHGLPAQLHFDSGPGGWPYAHIRNGHATATVSLFGAQLLSFVPAALGADLLFVSEGAVYEPGKAIRGGVPVCWPWFGPDPQGLGRPAHGLARTRPWAVHGASALPDGATQLVLGLSDTAETQALWPHAFNLRLTITVGRTLRLALRTRNTGPSAFELTQALHSYFAVSDIAHASVNGLEGCRYIDKATGANGANLQQSGPVHFSGEVDRVYNGAPAELQLLDGERHGRTRIRSTGSRTAVVWNPGATVAARMADLPGDAWRRFVCVETANAGDERISVPPGGQHTLGVEISQGD
ncbi:MAG: D-hexose-6-phosphate mutarotase [Hydrogenophaga sp.]|nr:D-hexose-6-phosphate mutarotase [Hydrogenophaga sp.]